MRPYMVIFSLEPGALFFSGGRGIITTGCGGGAARDGGSGPVTQAKNGIRMRIDRISPPYAMAGGLVCIDGEGFMSAAGGGARPSAWFGERPALIVSASSTRLVVHVPAHPAGAALTLRRGTRAGLTAPYPVASLWVADLHPVSSPALGPDGSFYTTFSGMRGQKVPQPLYRVTPDGTAEALAAEIVNPTGLAFDRQGRLYVSSRHSGTVYRLVEGLPPERFAGDLGVPTGLAFDADDNLYVGDRGGVIYRVTPRRQVDEFAHLEPSVSAYHMAFGPEGHLYVAGPTISTRDTLYRVDPSGTVSLFFKGLSRPQGVAFDDRGVLYLGASYRGRSGVFALNRDGAISHFLAGPVPVGLAFDRQGHLAIADPQSLHRVFVDRRGAVSRKDEGGLKG